MLITRKNISANENGLKRTEIDSFCSCQIQILTYTLAYVYVYVYVLLMRKIVDWKFVITSCDMSLSRYYVEYMLSEKSNEEDTRHILLKLRISTILFWN